MVKGVTGLGIALFLIIAVLSFLTALMLTWFFFPDNSLLEKTEQEITYEQEELDNLLIKLEEQEALCDDSSETSNEKIIIKIPDFGSANCEIENE